MYKVIIISTICHLLAYLGSLAVPVFLTYHFDNPKYLWLLFLVLFVDVIPTYEIKNEENKK